MRAPRRSIPLVILALAAAAPVQSGGLPDPSGTWKSPIGELALVRAGDTLSFSYSAVFGPTAHVCDGAGVATPVAKGRYAFTDEQGTVTFEIEAAVVRMVVTDGIASFCGAGWGGDRLAAAQPPVTCEVVAERSHFHALGLVPPPQRRSYVVRGDRVEVVPLQHEGAPGFVLGRYLGARRITAGLLRSSELRCP